MKKRRRKRIVTLLITLCLIIAIGYTLSRVMEDSDQDLEQATLEEESNKTREGKSGKEGTADEVQAKPPSDPIDTRAEVMENGMAVIAQPDSITALVNKQRKLPEDYNPTDLIYPDVRFIFSEKIEKRLLRQEAASALEQLFQAAEKDRIFLAGVSGYRSHKTQKSLFDRYVNRDGLEKAKTYSAFPGTSEHETGLAIDVSGSDGKCAAADCFGGTAEAMWLAGHAHEFGFIIRYPEGKEEITGYQYEPWHLRYVGTTLAAELLASGDTLEEYYDAVLVNK